MNPIILLIVAIAMITSGATVAISSTLSITDSIDELKKDNEILKERISENQKNTDELAFSIVDFAYSQGLFVNDIWVLDDGLLYYKVQDYYLLHLILDDEVWKITDSKTIKNLPVCVIDSTCPPIKVID